MNKVLEFPKDKSKKVRKKQRAEIRQAALTLSLFSFILVAVFSSEFLLRKERPQYLISDNTRAPIDQLNRAIASADPDALLRDYHWEQGVAKKLAEFQGPEHDQKSDLREPASTQQQLTSLDQLRFETLAGKYRVISAEGLSGRESKISEIEYVDSLEVADRPVQILDYQDFLLRYQALLSVPYSHVKLLGQKKIDGTNLSLEEWGLISDDAKKVGVVQIRKDEKGHFMGLKVQSQPLGRVSDTQK